MPYNWYHYCYDVAFGDTFKYHEGTNSYEIADCFINFLKYKNLYV